MMTEVDHATEPEVGRPKGYITIRKGKGKRKERRMERMKVGGEKKRVERELPLSWTNLLKGTVLSKVA